MLKEEKETNKKNEGIMDSFFNFICFLKNIGNIFTLYIF